MTRVAAERLVALAILAFSLAYFLLAFGIRVPPTSDDSPFSARTFPFALGLLGMGLSLVLLLRQPSGAEVGVRAFAWGRAVGLIVLMSLFALLIVPFGFVVTASLFLAGGFYVLGERRLKVLVPVAIITALGFWTMFTLLQVQLDWGLFGRMLR